MKKVIFLVVAIATVIVSSACGKKDDSSLTQDKATEQKLIGKWKHLYIKGLDDNGNELSVANKTCHYYEFLQEGKAI